MGRPLDPKVIDVHRQDGTTVYRVRVRARGKQTTETFASKAAARVFVENVKEFGAEEAVAMRDRADPNSTDYIPTLAEALTRHVDELTGVDQRTRDDYLSMARLSWLPSLGRYPLDALTDTHVKQWVNSQDGKVKPKTIKNRHSLLSATLEWAVMKGMVPRNVAHGIRLPRTGEEDVEENRYLTYAEFDALLGATPDYWKPFVIFLFGTGLRFSEATALQVQDINLAAGTVRVMRAWKREKGKGIRLGPPKSKMSRRTISLPVEVIDAIRPLLDRAGTAWLFTTTTGKVVQHSNFFNRIWRPATVRISVCDDHLPEDCRCVTTKGNTCQLHTDRDEKRRQIPIAPCGCAGTVAPRPRIHDARHTHASWLIAQGARLEVVQERLGHEDYATTRRVYAHLMPDMKIEAGLAASRAFAFTSLRAIES